jgi:hypothetical protein
MKLSYSFKSIHSDESFINGEIKGVNDYDISRKAETNVTELRVHREGRNKTIMIIPNQMLAIINVEEEN